MSDEETVVTAPQRRAAPVAIELRVAGRVFDAFTSCEVTRDVSEISGHFALEYLDAARLRAGLPSSVAALLPLYRAIRPGQRVEIALRDAAGGRRTVLIGHVEDQSLTLQGETVSCRIEGRDLTGDLVECAAQPQGPYEYREVGLLTIAQTLCAPFGIEVSADVPLGDPFRVVAIEPGEPVMSVLEKLTRARGVLITSDGVGGLRLTGPGTVRGPAPLSLPGNIHGLEALTSWRELRSDYWELGQAGALTRPSGAASLTPATVPGQAAAGAAAGARRSVEARATAQYGHAIDPEIGRYRPGVWVSRTLAGSSRAAQLAPAPVDPNASSPALEGAGHHPGRRRGRHRRNAMKPRTDASPWTLQDQAEWRMRTTRAHAIQQVYVVQGWDVAGRIWRPNELVAVNDAFSEAAGDRLIAGVTYVWGPDGPRTRLRMVLPDAYDLRGDAEQRSDIPRRRGRRVGTVDGTSGRS